MSIQDAIEKYLKQNIASRFSAVTKLERLLKEKNRSLILEISKWNKAGLSTEEILRILDNKEFKIIKARDDKR